MKTTEMNYTPIQLKMPVDMERIIDVHDAVYTFNEVVAHIDLNRYLTEKDCRTGNRIIQLNAELTVIHEEVLRNLNSIHGALLRMNRSIQSEGTYGEIKANRGYDRFRRRGINQAILEIALISCGFNLHKYHLSKIAKLEVA